MHPAVCGLFAIQVKERGTPPEPIYARDSISENWLSDILRTSIEGTEFFTPIGLESSLHYFPSLKKLDPEVLRALCSSLRAPSQKQKAISAMHSQA